MNDTKQAMDNQLKIVIRALESLNGKGSYDSICSELELLTGQPLAISRKMIVRQTLKQNTDVFKNDENDSNVWYLIGYQKKTEKKAKVSNNDNNEFAKMLKRRARTKEERLFKRICKQFDKVKYISDIQINDEEYSILVDYLVTKIHSLNTLYKYNDNPVFATALVQIGIKYYNGRFWPHINDIANVKLDGNKQGLIGNVFYMTLKKHNKLHVGPTEHVNNILMHCFITEKYASDFFEFLLAYYERDLDRDLTRHTKEMKDHLLACMKKAEDSPRAFKIKKGTADAATANELGCKIRITNILKLMDKYMFDNELPEKTNSRVTQLFIDWVKNSKSVDNSKKRMDKIYNRGTKHFRKPYIKFDIKKEQFNIVFPIQTVPLDDDELESDLSWNIRYNDNNYTFESDSESTVIGCRTSEIEYYPIDALDIFNEFKLDLIKDGNQIVNSFKINSDDIRIFDDDYDFIEKDKLPSGNYYIFTKREDYIETDVYAEPEHYLKLNYYALQLNEGNIIKKPNGIAIPVGKEFKEGLSNQHLIDGAYISKENNKHILYNDVPSVLIKLKEKSEAGTIIRVNGVNNRLNLDNCIIFKDENVGYKYYYIKLNEYCNDNGFYNVTIDVPNERKIREYDFVLFKDFSYEFLNAPYIFKDEGIIRFSQNAVNTISSNELECFQGHEYKFNISFNNDYLVFDILDDSLAKLYIRIPVFKWKFNEDDTWNIDKPDELWHKELTDNIYFKYPSESISVYSTLVSYDDEENKHINLNLDKEKDCFICDTRKIKSWLELGPAVHKIYIDLQDKSFEFVAIVTKCILADCTIESDFKNQLLTVRSRILGFSDCVLDVSCDGNLIAQKVKLTSNGAKIETNKLHGDYELVFYEYDEEDDEFEFDLEDKVYFEFNRQYISLDNKFDLIDKIIYIQYITEDKKTKSIFSSDKYNIKDRISILVEEKDLDDDKIYYGKTKCINPKLNNLKVEIDLLDFNDLSKAIILFYDEDEECYVDFLYDIVEKTLVTAVDEDLSTKQAKLRYLQYNANQYYRIEMTKRGE